MNDGARARLLLPILIAGLAATGVFAQEALTLRLRVPDSGVARPLSGRCLLYANCQERFLSSSLGHELAVRYRFRYSPVVVVGPVSAATRDRLRRSEHVVSVSDDGEGGAFLVESRAYIGMDLVERENGPRGTGRIVAVIDSGVESVHPDLVDAILHERHFLDQGADVGPGASDGFGHGTHVAGIVASRGLVAPPGIAPEVGIVAIRVLDERGRGYVSDWAAAVEYAVQLHASGLYRLDAINLSLGTDRRFDEDCDARYEALAAACAAAREQGIAVVAAAGNAGSPTSLSAPACLSNVLSVGAVHDVLPERITDRSNRGPLLDLLAPGRTIRSCGLGKGVTSSSGTSQAAPHVAAVLSLLRQIEPGAPVDRLEGILRDSGVPVQDGVTGSSYPRLDARAAVQALLAACVPGSSSFCGGTILRGDANLDGQVDVADALATLVAVYVDESAGSSCRAAADVNRDEVLDVSDAIAVLQFSFLGDRSLLSSPRVCEALDGQSALGCATVGPCPEVH